MIFFRLKTFLILPISKNKYNGAGKLVYVLTIQILGLVWVAYTCTYHGFLELCDSECGVRTNRYREKNKKL